MNQSSKEIGQPEQVTNNESKDDNSQVSPSNANAVLSARVFRKEVWKRLESLEKGKCFKSDVMDVIDAYLETSEIVRTDFIEKTCPYCKKKSIFKPQELKPNEVEVFYCSNCDSYMNGF